MSNWNRMKNDRKDNECLNWNGKAQENRGRLGWVESHLMAATWRVGSAFGCDCGSYFFAFFAVSFWREMNRLWLLQISFVPLWVLIFNVGTSNLNCKKKNDKNMQTWMAIVLMSVMDLEIAIISGHLCQSDGTHHFKVVVTGDRTSRTWSTFIHEPTIKLDRKFH